MSDYSIPSSLGINNNQGKITPIIKNTNDSEVFKDNLGSDGRTLKAATETLDFLKERSIH